MENWEKELRHKRKLETLVINRPEALKTVRRRVELSLTTVGWMVWIFLCRPFLILFLWAVGFRVFFHHMVDLGGLKGLLELKIVYIAVLTLIVFLMFSWNFYNKMRYGTKTRRKPDQGVSINKLEEFFKLPEGSAVQIQGMDEITVDFLDDHQLNIYGSAKLSNGFKGYFHST